jgi:hypothetical protein
LGQPSSRTGADFTYCMTDQRTATLAFDADGNLTTWGVTQP